MKNTFPQIVGIALLYATSLSPALATPISIGHLSSNDDGSTDVIKDTLNNREWLRWDILADLTFAQTQAIISSGGAYEGWNIGRNEDAQMFVNALIGTPNSCGESGYAPCMVVSPIGHIEGYGALVGDNFIANTSTVTRDAVFFLSNNGTGKEVGWIRLYESIDAGGTGIRTVDKHNEGYSISVSDRYSNSGDTSHWPVSWLLYRSATSSIPEPPTVLLLSMGIIGISFARKK